MKKKKYIRIFNWFAQKPEFTDKKVLAGKEYEYRVTAVNAGGESDPSEVSAPIKAKPLKGQFLLNPSFECYEDDLITSKRPTTLAFLHSSPKLLH